MKTLRGVLSLFILAIIASCHSLSAVQSSSVKKFAGAAKEVSDIPYQILYNYYSIKFERKQLLPENYITGDTATEQLDELAENVMSRLEELKGEYYDNLKTASEIKITYDLLQTYLTTLEKLSSDKYSKDLEKQSAEMGTKMNGLVAKLNASPRTKIHLSLNPGEWLSSLAIAYGRTRLRTKQAELLRVYIDKADTLVQAINRNYQEIQVPIMNAWFVEERKTIRDQFKRSIAPYLQNANRHADSVTSVVALDFYSRINPVYYALTDEIDKNEVMIRQTSLMMKSLAAAHSSLKGMFATKNDWLGIAEQVDGLKEKLAIAKDIFPKDEQEKFSFYKNFIDLNENSLKDILDKH